MKIWLTMLWIWAIFFWGLSVVAFEGYFKRRKAVRILSHAKFYLFATTCSYPQGRRRDSAAIDLLTAKLFEVRNG